MHAITISSSILSQKRVRQLSRPIIVLKARATAISLPLLSWKRVRQLYHPRIASEARATAISPHIASATRTIAISFHHIASEARVTAIPLPPYCLRSACNSYLASHIVSESRGTSISPSPPLLHQKRVPVAISPSILSWKRVRQLSPPYCIGSACDSYLVSSPYCIRSA